MIVYLDTSIVLRKILGEGSSLDCWGQWKEAFSSSLIQVETYRTLDRLRLSSLMNDQEVAGVRHQVETVFRTIKLVQVNPSVLEQACSSFPTVVGTLDAIHLSTAIIMRKSLKIDAFLTHDKQLALAARSVGFEVLGCP
ncbi:PIN domain-containing protein [Oscillatoria amoena NRMC-F 0135]|nr:PIN domain-containing protein [Oscillatoria amoena NRMC-F 0135]